ncbi:Flavohemoprotein [Fulvia fulva]|uniref:nitric oxide dioxygenase n=1 Tax=Passalora fulva TaxID=5499 RepID=A0A9Q8LFK2_PASFU|nr:Flavohemoprotein [Fulvia fulva]KAK4628579.1 Flavohemoprotein [Fulvia fulva]UJO16482.1 Flavohemoprotein [Fulvia fulva]WPV28704.1 Flavohemoprotein [Fulvia fulva]
MPLTPEQVKIVKSTAPVLAEHGNAVTTLFYETAHEEYPELHNVFNQTNQVNNHQAQALAGSLYAYASHIDDLGKLSPAVEKISQKHASLYIQPEHYPIVGEGLLRAMGKVLGDACTPEILDAWTAAYWQLANLFIEREEVLYAEAKGWTDWRDFVIADKKQESDEITSFYLKPVDGEKLPEYLPGQYTSVLTDVPQFGYKQSRQYSLSEAPRQDYYRISVKKEAGLEQQHSEAPAHPGWISNILHNEKTVGDVVRLSHPAGEFYFDPVKDQDAPIVLLSAGVGITPMIAILDTVLQRGSKQPIAFIHGARSKSAQAFKQHIRDQVAEHSSVHAVDFVKNVKADADDEEQGLHHVGRLALNLVDDDKDLYLNDSNTKYFVCGPEAFMADMWRGLKAKDVDESRIKMEVFGTGELPL